MDTYLGILDLLLQSPVANRNTEIWITKEDLAASERWIPVSWKGDPLAVLVTGGTAKRKQWVPQRYAQVVQRLREKDTHLYFLLLGGSEDYEDAEIIARATGPEACINLAGKMSFRQSAAIMQRCCFYMGSDTGTMHIAAAINLPVLELNCFPADHPQCRDMGVVSCRPYRVPSVIVQPPHGLDECQKPGDAYGCRRQNQRHCILQITPELVVKGYQRLQELVTAHIPKTLFLSDKINP
ncbi:MAG: glycosyltransferase family 9 protein [Schwartzia sp.]|nr:glycosyltransferase family 9 protein [Schwartzia sp. (in: firmicutes)]